ncbi:hypothetical protein HK098_002704 [Nowakowskiella sp. JEL0407]|nr:hypothetical protein HK098_002704 [Nowakowskiella sp. JEL0407]
MSNEPEYVQPQFHSSRLSYSPHTSANSSLRGHMKGINSLVLDFESTETGILYSAGRDACVNSWDLHIPTELQRKRAKDWGYGLRYSSIMGKKVVEEPESSRQQSLQSIVEFNPIDLDEQSDAKKYASLNRAFSNPSKQMNLSSSELSRSRSLNTNGLISGTLSRASIASGGASVSKYSGLDSNQVFQFNRLRRNNLPQTTHLLNYRYHTDWVNDIILCRGGQHFVTASSDRALYLWHSKYTTPLLRVGYHNDHVKTLCYARDQGWVASGGYDKRIVLWDLHEERGEICSMEYQKFVEIMSESAENSSIYALACNPSGSIMLSGSPEKFIRGWDVRTGKQIYRLGGHTDNIRALLVSEDGKWALSGSSDSTIKLWSLASPTRCVVTYTHYDDSVWSLASNHPNLEVFWAGGRDGLVTKVGRRRMFSNSGDYVTEDDELVDCVAVCREDSGVNKIAAIDDLYLWTATSSSSLHRWRDIPLQPSTVVLPKSGASTSRTTKGRNSQFIQTPVTSESLSPTSEEDSNIILIPSKAVIKYDHNDFTHGQFRLSTTSALFNSWDVTSRKSLGRSLNAFSVLSLESDDEDEDDDIELLWAVPDEVTPGEHCLIRHFLLNNKRYVATQDSLGEMCLWDIIKCEILERTMPYHRMQRRPSFGLNSELITLDEIAERKSKQKEDDSYLSELDLAEFEAFVKKWNTAEWIANWCSVETRLGFIYAFKRPPEIELEPELKNPPLTASSPTPPPPHDSKLPQNEGNRPSKPVVLEKATTPSPSDSKNLKKPSSPIPPEGKQSLIMKTLKHMKSKSSYKSAPSSPLLRPKTIDENKSDRGRKSRKDSKDISLEGFRLRSKSRGEKNKVHRSKSLGVISRGLLRLGAKTNGSEAETIEVEPPETEAPLPNEQAKRDENQEAKDEHSSRRSDATKLSSEPLESLPDTPLESPMPLSPKSHTRVVEELEKAEYPVSESELVSEIVKIYENNHEENKTDEITDKKLEETISPTTESTDSSDSDIPLINIANNLQGSGEQQPGSPVVSLAKYIEKNNGMGIVNLEETPLFDIPEDVSIVISVEDTAEVAGFLDTYRGSTLGMIMWTNELEKIAKSLPQWITDWLILDKAPARDPLKMSFLLVPVVGAKLPELPNGNNRLSSNKMIRIKKLLAYIVDKLNLSVPSESAKVIEGVMKKHPTFVNDDAGENDYTSQIKPEMWLEFICCEKVSLKKQTL